jgi:hypothetical protein
MFDGEGAPLREDAPSKARRIAGDRAMVDTEVGRLGVDAAALDRPGVSPSDRQTVEGDGTAFDVEQSSGVSRIVDNDLVLALPLDGQGNPRKIIRA